MLDIIRGSTSKPGATDRLVAKLQEQKFTDALLYIGYPIVTTADESASIDGLLISAERGVLILHLMERAPTPNDSQDFWTNLEETQSKLIRGLKSKLISHASLCRRGDLAFTVEALSFSPTQIKFETPPEIPVASDENLPDILDQFGSLDPKYLRPLKAAVQRVATIRPLKKRANVVRPDSRGAILKEIEKEIANLDTWQNQATIETPEGPQRIRGLAGSGKTIVLALKAAYLHAQHPDWDIALTFHTRSLYPQLRELVRRFSFEHSNDEPNWEKLRIMHSWGSARAPGFYYEVATASGLGVHDWDSAKNKYGRDDAFEGICAELVSGLVSGGAPPLYDAVIIDEAQDSPSSFFKLAYQATKKPKRVVYAYDEMQSIGSTPSEVDPPETLFSIAGAESFKGNLKNLPGQPHQDIVLPVCYRNTEWTLATAHSLGFGIYRADGMVQMFDEQDAWREIGYDIAAGTGQPGTPISIARRPECSPPFFRRLLSPDDAVQFHCLDSQEKQAEWVAEQVKTNLTRDELEPSDILLIFPNPLTVQERSALVMAELRKRGINSHIAGITRSRDEFFAPDSVTISGIFRAKGNEAPIVYLLDAQYCTGGFELIRKRNILFTAITRSRAWVRVCGHGEAMTQLQREFESIRSRQFKLEFNVPTDEQLKKMRLLHRDLSEQEKQQTKRAEDKLREAISALEAGGDLIREGLPEDVRQKLRALLAKKG